MQVPRNGEEPRRDPRVWPQPRRVLHETQPRFFEQIFGNVPTSREPEQKREQPGVEGLVDGIEGGRVAVAETADEGELGLPVHSVKNA